jgi:hypothetical protein
MGSETGKCKWGVRNRKWEGKMDGGTEVRI